MRQHMNSMDIVMGGVVVGRMSYICHVSTGVPLRNIYSLMGPSHGGTILSTMVSRVMCYNICMHENMTCWTAQISQSSEEDTVHWTCDMSTYGHVSCRTCI